MSKRNTTIEKVTMGSQENIGSDAGFINGL
jgi:hypothetical protein